MVELVPIYDEEAIALETVLKDQEASLQSINLVMAR